MNGAEALVHTLADCGVAACFANPGTSELHLVAALDHEPRIRSVLCLFEGCATGAADGYARIARRPAMTLLHLGPGYLNGAANLHNSKRAFSPVVTVLGDHATYHRQLDPPLTSDIEALVGPLAVHLDVVRKPEGAGPKAAQAYTPRSACRAGTHLLSCPLTAAGATAAGSARGRTGRRRTSPPESTSPRSAHGSAPPPNRACCWAETRCGQRGSSGALGRDGHRRTDRDVPRPVARGSGLFAPSKLPYFIDQALQALAGIDLLVVAGARHPVAFFASRGRPSELAPPGAERATLWAPERGAAAALRLLADELGAPERPAQPAAKLDAPKGKLDAGKCGVSLARHMPENAIICDDAPPPHARRATGPARDPGAAEGSRPEVPWRVRAEL